MPPTATDPSARLPLRGFRRLAIATTALTLVLVGLGGAVRATGSGLACPDWPLCYGEVIPRQADIPVETGFTLWNVWLEHSHRLVASIVGLLVAGLAVWALMRYRHRRDLLWPALAAVALVTVQAGLGAAVVLRLLRADLVTAHLGMAMAVLAVLLWIAVSAGGLPEPVGRPDRGYAWTVTIVAALCFVQILVGGHVTGIRAGLVYTDFPLMDGALMPEVSGTRELFHVAHRWLAYLLAVAVGVVCWRALAHRRVLVAAGRWTHAMRWLVVLPVTAALLVGVQIGLGVVNLRTGAAPLAVTAHLIVASLLWTLLALTGILSWRWAPRHAVAAPARAGVGGSGDREVTR